MEGCVDSIQSVRIGSNGGALRLQHSLSVPKFLRKVYTFEKFFYSVIFVPYCIKVFI
jgi:hypothetical protein